MHRLSRQRMVKNEVNASNDLATATYEIKLTPTSRGRLRNLVIIVLHNLPMSNIKSITNDSIQAIDHPSVVDRLVAIAESEWVTRAEACKCKGIRLYNGLYAAYAACCAVTTHAGSLQLPRLVNFN